MTLRSGNFNPIGNLPYSTFQNNASGYVNTPSYFYQLIVTSKFAAYSLLRQRSQRLRGHTVLEMYPNSFCFYFYANFLFFFIHSKIKNIFAKTKISLNLFSLFTWRPGRVFWPIKGRKSRNTVPLRTWVYSFVHWNIEFLYSFPLYFFFTRNNIIPNDQTGLFKKLLIREFRNYCEECREWLI